MIDAQRDGDVFEFLVGRLEAARTCLAGHVFPTGLSARSVGKFVWVGEPEGAYTCELELVGSAPGSKPVPARMFVEFIPDTDIVAVSACLLVDPRTGGVYSQFIGASPYMIGNGVFKTTLDGKVLETSWDLSLQRIHYCASLHVDLGNPEEVAAVAALRALGSQHGDYIGADIPALPRIDPSITAEQLLSSDSIFGRQLGLCLVIAARERATVNPQIGYAVEIVANMWHRFGQTIDDIYNRDANIIHVDFQRGVVMDEPELETAYASAPGY